MLDQLGLRFEILHADFVEHLQPGQSAGDYVLAMARGKAHAVGARSLPVLGADTEVVIDSQILGKPAGREEAIAMLLRLAAREHVVYSGVAVAHEGRCETALSVTTVRFGEISVAQAAAYWDTGEPSDKAGGYAIQGVGAMFVQQIRGSYSGVMGLPLFETCELLRRLGVLPQPSRFAVHTA